MKRFRFSLELLLFATCCVAVVCAIAGAHYRRYGWDVLPGIAWRAGRIIYGYGWFVVLGVMLYHAWRLFKLESDSDRFEAWIWLWVGGLVLLVYLISLLA